MNFSFCWYILLIIKAGYCFSVLFKLCENDISHTSNSNDSAKIALIKAVKKQNVGELTKQAPELLILGGEMILGFSRFIAQTKQAQMIVQNSIIWACGARSI